MNNKNDLAHSIVNAGNHKNDLAHKIVNDGNHKNDLTHKIVNDGNHKRVVGVPRGSTGFSRKMSAKEFSILTFGGIEPRTLRSS